MADDKLAQEAHEALLDMIQWVAAFAKGAGVTQACDGIAANAEGAGCA
jgi:hypothetical protein